MALLRREILLKHKGNFINWVSKTKKSATCFSFSIFTKHSGVVKKLVWLVQLTIYFRHHHKAGSIRRREESSIILSFYFITQKFLSQYHYISPVKNGNHDIKDALREFQKQSEIPDTGELDAATVKEMHKPRCGVADRDEEAHINSGKKLLFEFVGGNKLCVV